MFSDGFQQKDDFFKIAPICISVSCAVFDEGPMMKTGFWYFLVSGPFLVDVSSTVGCFPMVFSRKMIFFKFAPICTSVTCPMRVEGTVRLDPKHAAR